MRFVVIAIFAFLFIAPALAQDKPGQWEPQWQPWLAPAYKSPRGTKERIESPPSMNVPLSRAARVPPPIVVPQTGAVLPNIPALGSGAGGMETGQDRALRCADQAGIYGAQAGDRGAYVGGCINQ